MAGFVVGRTKKDARMPGNTVYATYREADHQADELNDELSDPLASGYFYAFPAKGK